MHLDLFLAHQIQDAPGSAVPAAERSHENIGIEYGFRVGNGDGERNYWFLCKPYTIS
jgi:hypothetical protein